VGLDLKAEQLEFLWIPEGFAHGFLVISETAYVFYKTTGFYYREGERCIRWNDPTLAIKWPLETAGEPNVSAKDAVGGWLNDAELPPPYHSK
jgi:dTDP-4-dehydrorhamnose 3,5-epimerase